MKKLYTGDDDETCPYMGGRLCKDVCPTCRMQMQIRGVNPNTGEPMDRWDCSINLNILLQLEGNRLTNSLGAAIESFRNETIEQNRALIHGSVKIAQKVIEGAERAQIQIASAPNDG